MNSVCSKRRYLFFPRVFMTLSYSVPYVLQHDRGIEWPRRPPRTKKNDDDDDDCGDDENPWPGEISTGPEGKRDDNARLLSPRRKTADVISYTHIYYYIRAKRPFDKRWFVFREHAQKAHSSSGVFFHHCRRLYSHDSRGRARAHDKYLSIMPVRNFDIFILPTLARAKTHSLQ